MNWISNHEGMITLGFVVSLVLYFIAIGGSGSI
jgi:hypothetical protein